MRLSSIFVVLLSFSSTFAQALNETKPTLGLEMVDSEVAVDAWKELGGPARLAPKKGLLIISIPPGSAADRIGIKSLDLLDKVNNKSVRSVDQVREVLAKTQPGEMIQITIRRQQGTGWHPIKGEIKCSSPRMFAYSQMVSSSASKVAESFQIRHHAFESAGKLIAPVIVVREGVPSLFLETKHFADDWLFMRSLTLKIAGKSTKVILANRNGEVDEGTCFESCLQQMSDEVLASLRATPTSKENLFRIDGDSVFTEGELSSTWGRHVQTVLEVYDDMIATKNVDLTLGGKIN